MTQLLPEKRECPQIQDKVAEQILQLRLGQLLINEQYKAGKFKVPIHLALGHEAIAVAVSAVMANEDILLLSHRNIAYNFARAGSLRAILDEYLLEPTGLAQARFGSMNLLNPERGVVYSSSILANQFPVAVGVSLGEQLFEGNGLVIVLGGDGSMEEGAFFESMVMARTMHLPMMFLIENNEWSMATKIDERRHVIDLAGFSSSLGVRYSYLQGNDAFEYQERLREIRSWSLEQRAPVCVEVKVNTLGDWRGPVSAEHPHGKFINYHAGPAPTVNLAEWPVIVATDDDPVFVLSRRFPQEQLRTMAKRQLECLKNEIA